MGQKEEKNNDTRWVEPRFNQSPIFLRLFQPCLRTCYGYGHGSKEGSCLCFFHYSHSSQLQSKCKLALFSRFPSSLRYIFCFFFLFRLEDDCGSLCDKFRKWHNGGGIFHESASIDSTAVVEVGAVVHSESVVAPNVRIGSGTVIGPSVSIDHSTKIGFNVAFSNCCIGESCVIHNGVCIGQDGFGFYVDGDGNMIKKPQMLNVIIGNHVEIGANTCIDRGSWRDTVIGDNSKIDNLVQIGHNVVIGKNCMLCGQVGIAGSATIGDYVTMGGRVAVRDHVSIVSRVRLAAASCVTKDIKEPGDYGGFPAVSIHKWRRQVASSCRTPVKRNP